MKPTAFHGYDNFDAIMDGYLPPEFRSFIEHNFYGRVVEQARLENLKKDSNFHKDPLKHIALYTDHGIVHVRDVALQVLEVIETANGVLMPFREKKQLAFLKGYALQLAYLHDIGMADFSEFGRFMHPEFAAQYVFTPAFDPMLECLWSENAGNIPWKLMRLFQNQCNEVQQKLVYREVLALSIAHSKSKMPIDTVNEPGALRRKMIELLSTPLEQLYFVQKEAKLRDKLSKETSEKEQENLQKKLDKLKRKKEAEFKVGVESFPDFLKHYPKSNEAYRWLEQDDVSFKQFIEDIQDSLRCIRAADALRQRGTVLRTSAGYEIFIDRKTANAIYALRDDEKNELYLLEGKKSVNAGEANLASSELDAKGNLRVSFHSGAFRNQKTIKKAAVNAALTIDDIQADVIQSFKRSGKNGISQYPLPKTSFEAIKILIERVDDNPAFADLVCEELKALNVDLSDKAEATISLNGADLQEVKRYLSGTEAKNKMKDALFAEATYHQLQLKGYDFSDNKKIPGIKDIRIIEINVGEELIRGGSPSGFVYIPLGEGLRVYPLGGYESKPASPWIPIGNTGVIRGSERNARVVAEKYLQLICIPKSVYLNAWYQPYSAKSLVKEWKS